MVKVSNWMLISLKIHSSYKLTITNKAYHYLKKIGRKNHNDAKSILETITEIPKNPYDFALLKGNFNKVRRVKVGSYRILFDIDENKNPSEVRIIDVGKRKNI